MNISLTDEEIRMVREALDAVWWRDTPEDASRGTTDTARAVRIQRKLQRALEHTSTEYE